MPAIPAVRTAAACALAALLVGSCRCESGLGRVREATERPDRVILIVVDTLRADEVSFMSPDAPSTPSMDALASRGIVFTRAMSPAPWTLPAVATILTGLMPDVHGMGEGAAVLPAGIQTLAGRLGRAGYHTAAAGVNPMLRRHSGLQRGFDEYHVNVQDWFEATGAEAPAMEWLGPDRRQPYYTGTPHVERFALDWIPRHEDRPFFLWLHFLDPHAPYHPPPALRPEVSAGAERAAHSRPEALGLASGRDRQDLRRLYHGEIRWVDSAIGSIMLMLEDRDLLDGSLVVLVSDHGEEFWEHGSWEHGHSLHGELLHVPLVVKMPHGRHAVRPEAVSIAGLAPMILDACGVDAPSPLSLSPLVGLRAQAYPSPPLHAGTTKYGADLDGVIIDGLKYVRSTAGEEMLFDLASDPGETASIAGQDPAAVSLARGLLDARALEAARIREALGIVWLDDASIDETTREELEALGYLSPPTPPQ